MLTQDVWNNLTAPIPTATGKQPKARKQTKAQNRDGMGQHQTNPILANDQNYCYLVNKQLCKQVSRRFKFNLFNEFYGMPLESFLALKTAEMIGFSLIGNLEFRSVFIKNHAANWISK